MKNRQPEMLVFGTGKVEKKKKQLCIASHRSQFSKHTTHGYLHRKKSVSQQLKKNLDHHGWHVLILFFHSFVLECVNCADKILYICSGPRSPFIFGGTIFVCK